MLDKGSQFVTCSEYPTLLLLSAMLTRVSASLLGLEVWWY